MVLSSSRQIQLANPFSECRNITTFNYYEDYRAHIEKYKFEYNYLDCAGFCMDILCQNSTDRSCRLKQIPICKPKCPQKCIADQYDITTSFSNFPTEYYFERRNKSVNNFERLKTTVLRLRISVKNLNVNIVEQHPEMVFNDLLSAIGGTLGCFLGASLLSIVEISEVGYELLVGLLKRLFKGSIVSIDFRFFSN